MGRFILVGLLACGLFAGCVDLPESSDTRAAESFYVRRVDIIEEWVTDGSSNVNQIPTRPRKVEVEDGLFTFYPYSLEFGEGHVRRWQVKFTVRADDDGVIEIRDPEILWFHEKVDEGDREKLGKMVADHKPVRVERNTWITLLSKEIGKGSIRWECWWGDGKPE